MKKSCVVVGTVSPDGAKLSPTGNFDPAVSPNLGCAQREFHLVQPVGKPGYEDDFEEVLSNVNNLLRTIPGNGPPGGFLSSINGTASLKFVNPIFIPEVSNFQKNRASK